MPKKFAVIKYTPQNKAEKKITMEEKYIKFYKTFHKKFKNKKNLILCSKTLSDGGVI